MAGLAVFALMLIFVLIFALSGKDDHDSDSR